MYFVIDENVPSDLIAWLTGKSHVTFPVPKGGSDEEVASIAKNKKSILLTLDRHFTNSLKFPPKEFFGIIRIKIHPSYIEDIIFSLDRLFCVFSRQEDFRSKLIILEKEGYFKLRE